MPKPPVKCRHPGMRKHPKEAAEDYLKAIYTLEQQGGAARTSALATALGVTPGSVTDMLKRLGAGRPRLITYTPHRGAALTARGRERTIAIVRRHRLIETFLKEVLGYGWEEVHAEADILEHHVSERFINALDELLRHPESDPHGDPIPTADGQIPETAYVPVDSLEEGVLAVVKRVRSHDERVLHYLAEKGIHPGARLRLREKAPAGGPVSVDVIAVLSQAPATVALSAEMAAGILVSDSAT